MSPWLSVRFLQTQSDARLLDLSRAGHERAFEALVHRYRKSLLAHCHRMGVPTARAEDAVQQGLLQAWVALQDEAEVRNARPWLHRIVHNAALRTIGAPGHGEAELSESLIGADAPHFELDRRITARETLAGVAALPLLQREALIRTAVNGQSHEHVAAALGLSDGAVRGLVYRARTTLRNAATALTPFPLVAWAAHAGRKGHELSQSFAGVGAGGGAAGVGVLVKGGVAVTAGVLVVGAAIVHPQRAISDHRADAAAPRGRIVEPHTPAHEAGFIVGGGAVRIVPARALVAWHRAGGQSGGDGRSALRSGSGASGPTTRGSGTGAGSGVSPSSDTSSGSGASPSSATSTATPSATNTAAPPNISPGDSGATSNTSTGATSGTTPNTPTGAGAGAGTTAGTSPDDGGISAGAGTTAGTGIATNSPPSPIVATDDLASADAGAGAAPPAASGSTSGD